MSKSQQIIAGNVPLTSNGAVVKGNGIHRSAPPGGLKNSTVTPQQEVLSRAESYQLLRGVNPTVHRGAYEYGYNIGFNSKTLVARDEHLKAIDEHMEAVGEEVYRDFLNTDLYAHDRAHVAEHRKHLADRDAAEDAEKYAAAEVRESEKSLTKVCAGNPPEKPGNGKWFAIGAAAALAVSITLAPTFHDLFFLLPSELLAWLLSLGAGLIIGLIIVTMILFDTGATARKSLVNWLGITAGILIAFAFGIIRYAEGDPYYAVGLTVLEIAIVLGVEGAAMSRRAERSEYATELKAHSAKVEHEAQLKAEHEADISEHQRCKERVRETDLAVKSGIAYFEERAERSGNKDAIKKALRAAARHGYFAAVAANVGHVRGTRKEVKDETQNF